MLDIYAANKAAVWIMVIAGTFVLCSVHYIVFGPCRIDLESRENTRYVQRFSPRERVCHWITLLIFLVVITTGVMQVLSRTPSHIGPFHGNLGVALIILFIINLITWSKDSLFKAYDLIWLRSMGGYLSKNNIHLPAGRFNAGQKIYFWLIVLSLIGLLVSAILMEQGHGPHSWATRHSTMWSIHGLIGCFTTAMVIGHAYLSTLANPQTIRVLFYGNISRSYAREHHSRWAIKD